MKVKRQVLKVTDWQDGQKRLDHYNAWLMDPTREFGGAPYPGYPEDKNDSYSEGEKPTESVETSQDAPVFSGKKSNKINKLQHRKVTVALSGEVSHNKNTKSMKGNVMTKVTNLSKATEIVRVQVEARVPKAAILDMIVAELSVSRSNAFVYFTKATKALGFSITVDKGATKAPRATKVAKNKVTELSPEKAAKKVAEIDAVIAGLKANGAKVASPFAQLGV